MDDKTDKHLDYLLTERMGAGVTLLYMLSLVLPVGLIGLVIWGLIELIIWIGGLL